MGLIPDDSIREFLAYAEGRTATVMIDAASFTQMLNELLELRAQVRGPQAVPDMARIVIECGCSTPTTCALTGKCLAVYKE